MERKLTAILAADVKGYSRLMGEDEEATLRALNAYRKVMDTLIAQHRGRVVGSAGDSVLAEFASVVDAVQCAVVIQVTLKAENASQPPNRRMEFRIGINLGDVMVDGEQIYGDGVNIAARLESLADPGGICISGTVHEHIKNKLALAYEDLGEQVVKNIAEPVWVWRVQAEESESPKSQVPSPKSKIEGPKSRRVGITHLPRLVLVFVSVLLLAGIVALLYPSLPPLIAQHLSLRRRSLTLLPLPDKPSIVVLPFVNMSEDPKQEYFSDGIAEDLTTALSQISSLFVIARNSAFTYKGKAVKVQDVGRELGVQYVLEGSVRRANDQVRITAQLVDATTDSHLWAERYDRPLKDIFALQDEIVQKIVTTLKVQLTLLEQGHLVHKSTDNLEAYDYYLRGVEYYWRYTKDANAQARLMLEKAIKLDPKYAAAYAYLGWTYVNEWVFQWSQDPQTVEQAFALAQRAVALDDSLPGAHLLLGRVYAQKKQHEQAIAEGERAIALDANDADGYVILARILGFAGRPEEAIGLVEKAMRLNPRYPAFYLDDLGIACYLMRRYEEAIAAFKRCLTRNPDIAPAHTFLAVIYSELGRKEEARTEVAEVLRLSPQASLEFLKQRAPTKIQRT